jgi:NADH-quinone oxidoreductase subunit J
MEAVLFYLFAGLTLGFTLMVVLLRDPIISAFSLIASFFSVSALFVLLHAPFLAVIQVLVYTGAILVLFLYVLMLLDLRKERTGGGMTDWLTRVAGLGSAGVVLAFLVPSLELTGDAGAPVGDAFGSLASVGRVLLGPYALVFEAVSLVLLAGMIGVIVLAPSRREEKP